MAKVRHFYVDNLLENLDATIATTESTEGGEYPPGPIVELVPFEVMVKHPRGFNAATHDWEFFELGVSGEGSTINKRGFASFLVKYRKTR